MARKRHDAAHGLPQAAWMIHQVRDHYGQADDRHAQDFLDALEALPSTSHPKDDNLLTSTGQHVTALLDRVRRAHSHFRSGPQDAPLG